MVLAFCTMSDHCGGEDIDSCNAARASLLTSCATTVDDSATCVEAVNGALANECSVVPADLPCPAEVLSPPAAEGEGEGSRDTRYRLCSDDDGCEAPLVCSQPVADELRFCSLNCAAPSECPAPTNGQDAVCFAGLFCAAGCESDQQCAEDMTCSANPGCIP